MADLDPNVLVAPVTVNANPPPPATKATTWSFFSQAGAAEPEGGQIAAAKAAGFTEGEIAAGRAQQRREAIAAGFTPAEIDKEMGVKPPLDMSNVQKMVNDNLSAHDKAIADAEDKAKEAETIAKTKTAPVIPNAGGGVAAPAAEVPVTATPKPDNWYDKLVDSASKGWGSSITGMLAKAKAPESLPEDADWASKMAYSAAGLAGDVPFMIGGAMAGGAAGSEVPVVGTVIGGGIGAFAVPGMIRKSLVDNLQKGSYVDAADFAQRTMGMLYEGVKQGSVGGLTAMTGGVAGAATKAAGPLISGTAQTMAEIATMTTAGKALERELPSLDDFTTGAALVAAMHGSIAMGRVAPAAGNAIVKKMQDIYVKTGIRPLDVAEMAKNDPTIAQDIITGQDIPDALKDHVDPTLRPNTIPKLPTAPEVEMGKEPPAPPGGEQGDVSPDPWKNVSDKIDFSGQDKKEPFSFRSLYTRVINDLHPIFSDQKQMLESLGKDLRDLPADKSPYTLAQVSRGTFGRADQQLEHHTYDFSSYKNNGDGLREILKPIENDLKDWATYAVAKRSVELAQRGIDGGVPLADAQEIVRGGAGKYDAINEQVIQFQNRVVKHLRDSGIISPEMYDKMLDLNKNYTPFFRVMDENSAGIGGGLNTSNPIHAIKGSDRQIINPLESIVKNTYLYTALAERNAVGKTYLKLAESTGHPEDWLTKVNPKITGVTLNEGEIEKLFNEFLTVSKKTTRTSTSTTETTSTNAAGETSAEPTNKIYVANKQRVMDALTSRGFTENESETMLRRLTAGIKPGESAGATSTTSKTLAKEVETTTYVPEINIRLPNDVATVFRALREPLEANQIAVFKDGERTVYELKNKDTAEAFKGVDRQSANIITKVLSVPAATLRAGATSISPDFILRNPVRDQVSSFVYGTNFPVVGWIKGVMSLVKGDAAFENWQKGGGANAAMVTIDRDYLRSKLADMGLLDSETGLMSRAWNVVKSPLDMLQVMSEVSENASRLGNFRQRSEGILGGKSQENMTKADILAAAQGSREDSLDFAKKGSQMRAMNMITDFFSANLNGLDKMVRSAKDNPAGFATKVFVGVTLPSILLYEAQKDDPRMNDGSIPQWQKDLFYLVLTDKNIYRIPKDFQLGVIFGSGAEHILKGYDDYRKGQSLNTQEVSNYLATVWGSAVPPLIPTAITPFAEQATNHSFFSGQKLVPDSKEKLLPEYQYNAYTSELTKKVGSLIGTFPGMRSDFVPQYAKDWASPMVIDNYIRQWTGGLGNYVVQLLDLGLRKTGIINDPVNPAASTLADVPVVKAFVVRYPSAQAQGIQDFYARESNNQKTYDTIQMLAKTGDILGLQKELGLGPDQQVDMNKLNTATAMMTRMPGIKAALGQMTQAIHAININPAIKSDEKRQLIDTLYFQMIEVSKSGNDAFRQIDDLLGRSLLKPPPKNPAETKTQAEDFVRG